MTAQICVHFFLVSALVPQYNNHTLVFIFHKADKVQMTNPSHQPIQQGGVRMKGFIQKLKLLLFEKPECSNVMQCIWSRGKVQDTY